MELHGTFKRWVRKARASLHIDLAKKNLFLASIIFDWRTTFWAIARLTSLCCQPSARGRWIEGVTTQSREVMGGGGETGPLGSAVF